MVTLSHSGNECYVVEMLLFRYYLECCRVTRWFCVFFFLCIYSIRTLVFPKLPATILHKASMLKTIVKIVQITHCQQFIFVNVTHVEGVIIYPYSIHQFWLSKKRIRVKRIWCRSLSISSSAITRQLKWIENKKENSTTMNASYSSNSSTASSKAIAIQQ